MTVLTIAIALALSIVIVALVGKYLRDLRPKPCYRCGGEARVEYMGLHYCGICREVIVRMLPIVGLGGMYGFPGAPGYLEFPERMEKKEG